MQPHSQITKEYRLIKKFPAVHGQLAWLPYDWHNEDFCRPPVYGGDEINTPDFGLAVQTYTKEVERILKTVDDTTVSLYELTITWSYDDETEDYVRVGSSPALLSQTSNFT